MKKLIHVASMIILATAIASCGNSSNNSNGSNSASKTSAPTDPKAYFSQYLGEGKMNELVLKSIPDKNDCQAVFKGSDADTYLAFIKEFAKENPDIGGGFGVVEIGSFTTKDIDSGADDFVTGGMKRIKDKFQPDITFYQLRLKKDATEQYGTTLNYWVYVNGHWAFFVKPWRAFSGG